MNPRANPSSTVQVTVQATVQERLLCTRCFRAQKACYCGEVRSFKTQIQFVLLQHPLERRKSIGTARMTHHCIENSRLITGVHFDDNLEVQGLIADPGHTCVILYPGPRSQNISLLNSEELERAFPQKSKLVIFVIDGTWACAKKMLNQSPCLWPLPQISFTPGAESEYKIRQQPKKYCLSTIEAVHRLLGILDPQVDASSLLTIFRSMVERQLRYSEGQTLSRQVSRSQLSEPT